MIVKQPNKKYVPPKNLNGLQVGQEFKTLTELSKFLGVTLPSNRAASPCLDTWKKYFDWEKVSPTSHKIVITDIYVDTTTQENIGLKELQLNTLTKNRQEVQTFLIKRMMNLLQENGGELTIDKKHLLQELGVCNEKYWNYSYMESFTKDSETSYKFVQDFHSICHNYIQNLIDVLLRDLQRRGYITVSRQVFIKSTSDKNYRLPTTEEFKTMSTIIRSDVHQTLDTIQRNMCQNMANNLFQEYQESYSVAKMYVIRYIGEPHLEEYSQLTKRERNNFNKLLREKIKERYKTQEKIDFDGYKVKRSTVLYDKMNAFFLKNY